MKRVLFLRGKFKGLFFLLRLHYLIPSHYFSFLGQISALSRWISKHKNTGLTDFYSFYFKYTKREELFSYVIEKECLNDAVDYLEFGVSKGVSFKWWADKLTHDDARFYGFDTFTGLPEDWGPFKKGDMSSGEELPFVPGNRHFYYQGLFQQTLLPFLASYDTAKRKVIHMDADLYTATLYVLTLITPFLKKGDIGKVILGNKYATDLYKKPVKVNDKIIINEKNVLWDSIRDYNGKMDDFIIKL
jgi:hypothetical protein